jgi:hypothetical protein
MPAGVKAFAGAGGAIFDVPSAIVVLRDDLSALGDVKLYGPAARLPMS